MGADFASAQIVSITDSNLRAAIESALRKTPGTSITTTELATLAELIAPNADISDLTGLEAATNLKRLDLGAAYVAAEGRSVNSNAISDLSPLAGLTNLTRLDLEGNNISDILPLVSNWGLGEGEEVIVSENPFNDASINVHIPALQSRGVRVFANDLKPTTLEYTLSLSLGYNLIHVPCTPP